jgi:hypothetical protein
MRHRTFVWTRAWSAARYGRGVGQLVVNAAVIQCAMGMAPGVLTVLPASRVTASGQPVANIFDSKPFVNIAPFGMCMSLANPAVAAATAAAFGALTPMPCTPMTAAPWVPGSPTVMSGPAPALTNSSQCICSFGGVIQITMPGQFTAQAP